MARVLVHLNKFKAYNDLVVDGTIHPQPEEPPPPVPMDYAWAKVGF